ncbi:hypothetical protein [Pseudooceanicola sp. 200-1SW]|uniref:hypothetical protein n=1 Tax=Pseudooceanicola sp. 200-1SW TaxID=3425949 RepID=UPI003D7F4A91
MVPLLALLIALCLVPGGTQAQAILRSGDHSDFTRLTLPLPAGTEPLLDTAPGTATLRFDGPVPAIDASRVFDRITRQRLTDIRVGDGPSLTLSLACDCPVETSVTAGNLMILDILDGPVLGALPAAEAPAPVATDTPPAPTGPPPLGFGLPPADPTAPGPVPLAAPAAPRVASARVPGMALPPPPADAPEATVPKPASEALPPLPPVTLPGVPGLRDQMTEQLETLPGPPTLTEQEARLTRELEESLLAAIGSAATEGLLAPDARQAAELTEAQRQVSGTPSDGVRPDPGLAATPSTFGPGDPRGDNRIILSGNPCALHMPPLVAVEDLDFLRELGRLRAALTGEFDRDDVAAYHALALLYLAHGFGAEAARVLDAVPQPPLETAEMLSVARILEYGHDPEDSPFAGRLTCDTDAALWAALAPATIPPGSAYDGAAIKRSLMAMPDALKAVIGPLLANRFTAAKEADFARDILRIVERNLLDSSPRQALAAAKLANADGPPDRADFAALIASNNEVSPEALLHYTNETLAHGGQVDAEIIGLLEGYRSQYRNSPMATDLARAEVLAHAAASNFPAAFALYAAERARFAPETQAELSDALTRALAEGASDTIFTRLYFTQGPDLAAQSSAQAVNGLADRLLALGLPETAEALLADAAPARGAEAEARQLLHARAALAMNLPRKAEAELEGIATPEADRLRADARLAREDYAGASALFTAAGAPEAAAEAAWLARDWQSLAEAEAAAEKARLAEVVQQAPVDLPALGPPTLAASREVLGQSGATRDALRDLLSTMQVAPENEP